MRGENESMELDLSGKIVLITGAASGIGAATARAFAAEGAHLAFIDRNEHGLMELAQELSASGVAVSRAVADLSTREGVCSGIAEALTAHAGRIDVLVNNVGVCVPRRFEQASDEDWLATWTLNCLGYKRACEQVLPRMRAQASGCIVNTASDLARQPEVSFPDYAASKAALLSLTKTLALELAPHI